MFFYKFRSAFMSAGFEIIDCPPLTRNMKNAADVRMALDVMDLVRSGAPLDEVVIASGDSDFAPLLSRVRSLDVRTMVLSSGVVARAYSQLADFVVEGALFADLLSNGRRRPIPSEVGTGVMPAVTSPEQLAEFQRMVDEMLGKSSGAVNLAAVGLEAHRRFGTEIRETRWFGARSMLNAVGDRHHVSGDWLYDPTKIDPSDLPHGAAPGTPAPPTGPYGVDIPTNSPATWQAIFHAIAEFMETEEFNLARLTMFVRDQLLDGPHQIPRSTANWVAYSLRVGGVVLDAEAKPTAEEIGRAVLRAVVLYGARARGVATREMYGYFVSVLGLANAPEFDPDDYNDPDQETSEQ